MRIASLAFRPHAEDARVRRTATALSEAGHDVLVIARAPSAPDVPYAFQPLGELPSPLRQRLDLVAVEAPATLVPALAPSLYWALSMRRDALRETLRYRPDIVICNDWNTLPIGVAVKRRLGARLIYDSHEFATREHVQNWKWRLVSRRTVSEIERRYIGAADLTMTVSGGIARALKELHGLAADPAVIRNLPPYRATAFRPARAPLTVLFHGLIRQERGLEELIDSMPLWTFAGRVVIRGFGIETYIDQLMRRARARGVADRVAFEPRVSPDKLITRAAEADLGYLALPDTTEHYEYALPNKLFEYFMAGLPVVATERAEIAEMLRETRAGVMIDLSAQSIAAALNGLRAAEIDEKRKAALAAAERFNWENEKSRLVSAVESLRAARTAPATAAEGHR